MQPTPPTPPLATKAPVSESSTSDVQETSEVKETTLDTSPKTYYQAIGWLRGKLTKEEDRFHVEIKDKTFPLYLPRRVLVVANNHLGQMMWLKCYPQSKGEGLSFKAVWMGTEQNENGEAGIFVLRGVWQFIPQSRRPVFSIYRNELKDYENRPNNQHLPLIWADQPPYRFRKDSEEKPKFYQILARLIPQRACFGFVSQIADPIDKTPRGVKKTPIGAPDAKDGKGEKKDGQGEQAPKSNVEKPKIGKKSAKGETVPTEETPIVSELVVTETPGVEEHPAAIAKPTGVSETASQSLAETPAVIEDGETATKAVQAVEENPVVVVTETVEEKTETPPKTAKKTKTTKTSKKTETVPEPEIVPEVSEQVTEVIPTPTVETITTPEVVADTVVTEATSTPTVETVATPEVTETTEEPPKTTKTRAKTTKAKKTEAIAEETPKKTRAKTTKTKKAPEA